MHRVLWSYRPTY